MISTSSLFPHLEDVARFSPENATLCSNPPPKEFTEEWMSEFNKDSFEFLNAYKEADANIIADAYLRYRNIENESTETVLKIPAISHHIWITNPGHPREIRSADLNDFIEKTAILDAAANTPWQHIVWTNCKACIPHSIGVLKYIAQYRNVEFREFSDYQDRLESVEVLQALAEKQAIGMAADVARLDVLKHFGGFYTDFNYHLFRSPESLMKRADFFADQGDCNTLSLENYMIAAIPAHPAIVEALQISLERIGSERILGYEVACFDVSTLTNIMTYNPLSIAFSRHAADVHHVNVIIPDDCMYDEYRNDWATCEIDSKIQEEFIEALTVDFLKMHGFCMASRIGEDGTNGESWLLDSQDQEASYNHNFDTTASTDDADFSGGFFVMDV